MLCHCFGRSCRWSSCRIYLLQQGAARSEAGHIRGYALRQDEGRVAMLVLTVIAALASLGAILGELGSGQGTGQAASRTGG